MKIDRGIAMFDAKIYSFQLKIVDRLSEEDISEEFKTDNVEEIIKTLRGIADILSK